jgi:predicted amidohydrolase
MKLRFATCQFPVSDDIVRNLKFVLRQMTWAKRRSVRVVHFPETYLSGYCGVDFKSFARFDWNQLTEAAEQVMIRAAKLH